MNTENRHARFFIFALVSMLLVTATHAATPYHLQIGKIHNGLIGQVEPVPVTLTAGDMLFSGFDIRIAYADSTMRLQDVTPGSAFFTDSRCGWEYFTYMQERTGTVRVIGVADMQNNHRHPHSHFPDTLPAKLFTLNFIVGEEDPCHQSCEYYPLRFVWESCSDNTISGFPHDTLWISRNVYDFDFTTVNIADSTLNTYPTIVGAQICGNDVSCGHPLKRFVDFTNGGIDMVCADSVDARGDLNLDGLSYQGPDLFLFANYFLHGLSVFTINQSGQVAASDVNGDSIPLTVADFMYLYRGIFGLHEPCQVVTPPSVEATYTVCDGVVSIDTPIGAAFLVAQGNVTPTLLLDRVKMQYAFDTDHTNIFIYMSQPIADTLHQLKGNFVSGVGTLISAEFGTLEGGRVIAQKDTSVCDTARFKIRIGVTGSARLGMHQTIPVTLEAGTRPFDGFSFTIAFDDSLLDLSNVLPGDPLFGVAGCSWEYFTYRYHPPGGCANHACDFGRVQVAGIAETENGEIHPACLLPSPQPALLFTLDFLVTGNSCYGDCRFSPLRFFWQDCGDNVLNLTDTYNPVTDTLFISHTVIDYRIPGDTVVLTDSSGGYPTFAGAQVCDNPNPAQIDPVRLIDFYNGGLGTTCTDELDIRGDMDLNGYSFEPADFDLFTEYFLHGLSVFRVNTQGQIQTSDVNNDTLTLTVADLVYMANVIHSGSEYPARPCGIVPPPMLRTVYQLCGDSISVDTLVGAAFIVAETNMHPQLLINGLAMKYFYDGQYTNILVYNDPRAGELHPFQGKFLSGVNSIVSAEFSSPEGGVVDAIRNPYPCDTALFTIQIDTVQAAPGQPVDVNVVLQQGRQDISELIFFIQFDTTMLTFSNVTPGVDWFDKTSGCGWEYFAFRNYQSNICPDCDPQTIKVVGLADFDPPPGHPSCFIPPILPSVLFSLHFTVRDIPGRKDEFLPLRFFWKRCGANGFTDPSSSTIFISRSVFDNDGHITDITDSNTTYPTIHGDQLCRYNGNALYLRSIDFINGGIQLTDTPSADTTPFRISIETTKNSTQGLLEHIDVTLEQAPTQLSGFDLLMAYESSALNFIRATPGPSWYGDSNSCGWEYFTYRQSAFGNCGSACATGKVRVTGIAETDNGMHHPSCFMAPALPSVLFTMDFVVTDNRAYECAFLPIQFVWFDCGDNILANEQGDSLFLSRHVISPKDSVLIADSLDSYPTFKGVQLCNTNSRYSARRAVDFYDGGVQIDCQWVEIDIHGDINLNGLSNEVADAVLFSEYFIHGLSAFKVNTQGQIETTDLNRDSLTLTVADLVYLDRVIVGDAYPYPKHTPATMTAQYSVSDGKLSIDSTVGAAYVVVAGNVVPTLLASNMDMQYAFDGTNTHILVYTDVVPTSPLKIFNGSFLSVPGRIVSVEFATPEGGMVNATQAESGLQQFILGQNYPNPFNLTTRISFSLPAAMPYTLTIYNIAGQRVFETAKRGVSGINAVDWSAAHEASGVYFYKLTAGTTSETKKMIFLK